MFKSRKQTSHHRPDSQNDPHPGQNRKSHKHARGHSPYDRGSRGRKEYSGRHGHHRPDLHEHGACQDCPYKRSFYEHFHHRDDKRDLHGDHHGDHAPHPHSGGSAEVKRLEDGNIQCLGCPNECIMKVLENGDVEGNHCPEGAEAAMRLKG